MNRMSKNDGLESKLKRFAGKAALVGLAAVSAGTAVATAACLPNKTITETYLFY